MCCLDVPAHRAHREDHSPHAITTAWVADDVGMIASHTSPRKHGARFVPVVFLSNCVDEGGDSGPSCKMSHPPPYAPLKRIAPHGGMRAEPRNEAFVRGMSLALLPITALLYTTAIQHAYALTKVPSPPTWVSAHLFLTVQNIIRAGASHGTHPLLSGR